MKDLLGDDAEAGALSLGEPVQITESEAALGASLIGGATIPALLAARASAFVASVPSQGGAAGGDKPGGGVHQAPQ